MQIRRVSESEHTEFLQLVNAEIRPDRAKTNAWQDFPLILAPENRENQLVCVAEDGTLAGCIACLIREFRTSCGVIAVAGVGSVVTRPHFRGKGLSSALQNAILDLIKGKNVPLAVLWTDQPEIYSGRGFTAAGWEIHADMGDLAGSCPLPAGCHVREFQNQDTPAVETLYHEHPLGTCRQPGDSVLLYGMAGTTGLVVEGPKQEILAAAFCGKGADFPSYVAEWSGDEQFVMPLLMEIRNQGLAQYVLIPPGREELVNALVDLGGSWQALSSGLWNILDPAGLNTIVTEAGGHPPADPHDASAWLGHIDDQGQPLVGPLTLAVWGFDSV